MKYSSNYSRFIDEIVQEYPSIPKKDIPELKEKLVSAHNEDLKVQDERLQRQFDLQTKKWLSIVIVTLFGASYMILIMTLGFVFFYEIFLIQSHNLKASDRSINSKVIMVLVGGTITQTAIAFIALSKHFFGSSADK